MKPLPTAVRVVFAAIAIASAAAAIAFESWRAYFAVNGFLFFMLALIRNYPVKDSWPDEAPVHWSAENRPPNEGRNHKP